LFKPRVPIGGGFRAAYGWAVGAGIATHSGGNGWSYAVAARWRRDGSFVFWATNRAAGASRWNLETLARRLTLGIQASSAGSSARMR
jgi:hypothetical protein